MRVYRGHTVAACAAAIAIATILLFGRPDGGAALAGEEEGALYTLVETKPDEPWKWDFPTIADGSLVQHADPAQGGYHVTYNWTPAPQTVGADGFDMTFSVTVDATGHDMFAGLGGHGDGFLAEPSPGILEINLPGGGHKSDALTVRFTPRGVLEVGQTFEFYVGATNGPGVTYVYRVDRKGTLQTGELTASITDCPTEITISELPSVNCHITISGFRHATADPVQVILPAALDLGGNHGNGIQLHETAGELSVYNMSDPYQWGMFIFACPGQPGAGVNCNGTATPPGSVSVPIIVRQKGRADARLRLSMTAVAGPNSVTGGATGSGTAVASVGQPAGPGQLGAEIVCPGAITISALPSLNCRIVISGWVRNTAAPVKLTLPSATDTFGNHANGIQIVTQAEEDVANWDGSSHDWGMFVFACPGQSSAGANCNGSITSPGVQTTTIQVEQTGMLPAVIQLVIDAQARP